MRPKLISVLGWAIAGLVALIFIVNNDARSALPDALLGSMYWILGGAAGFALFWGAVWFSKVLRRDRTPDDSDV